MYLSINIDPSPTAQEEDGPGPSKKRCISAPAHSKKKGISAPTPSDSSESCVRESYSDVINFVYLAEITKTEQDTLNFVQHYGLIPKSIMCPKCSRPITKIHRGARNSKRSRLLFRCCRSTCRNSVSPRKGTFFEGSNISLRKALVFMYLFIRKADYKTAIVETSGPCFDNQTTSSETVVDMYSYCREVCIHALFFQNIDLLGGPNSVVEISQVKFGKWKKGRLNGMDGQWALGGICRETRQCFFVVVPDLSASTLQSLIIQRVAPGTVIHTDGSEAYSTLSDYGFVHQPVNHSKGFVDPDTGAHTNLIQNTWWCLKKSLPVTCSSRTDYAAHFAEFLWRRKHEKDKCLFTAFLKDVVKVYPGL